MAIDALRALQIAAEHFRHGRLEQAAAICARHQDAADALHLLALVRKQQRRWGDAERLMQQCLQRQPARADIRSNFGNLLSAVGRTAEAEQEYRVALAIDPAFRPARLGLARLMHRDGRHAAALGEAEALLERNPRDAEAWTLKGTAARATGDATLAEAALRRAVAINSQSGVAHHNLGALLAEQSRSEEALAELERAAAAGVHGAEIDFNRASALFALYRLKEAERILLNAVHRQPDDARAHRLLARLRYMRGDSGYASEISAAVASVPADIALRRTYAQLLRGAGRYGDAEATLEEALQLSKNNVELLAELAAVHLESGRFEAALEGVQRALRNRPDSVALDELRIDSLLALGRADEAMPVIESLRLRNPLNQWYVAMEATAARLLGDARYEDWYDYENLVQVFDVEPPRGWSGIDAFHEELVPFLLERHRFVAEPLDQSLRHGTQTARSLLSDPHPLIRAFLGALEQPLEQYQRKAGHAPHHPFRSRNRGPARLSGCWSVRLRRHGYHVNHVHPEGWISSAYYVDVPSEAADTNARAGWLKFGEPRFAVPGATAGRLVQPEPGRLVLFPSYLWHGTTPLHSDEQRLTIAFDAVPAAGARSGAAPR